ncbi:energy transducer TonB [Hymenobacter perfusus]|uniref:Energy transducer TonB n=1 Tax=Hymenobacter perfusus TaxID=1236770 RepID=A0A3R9MKY9_9BACT|nr:energy transducer TonB [Hymenobacter perfusus]RSK42917.1 energy transducer TonB [Hymenobacter perfusus]
MTTAAHTSLPSLDDMVFEGRNKAYGAYVLRKVYGQHVAKAVTISIALALVLIAVPVLVQRIWPVADVPPIVEPKGPVVTLLRDPTTITPPTAAVEPPATVTVVVRPVTVIPTRVAPDEQVKDVPKPDDLAPVIADGPVVVGDIARVGNGGTTIVSGPVGNDTATKPAAPAVTQPFVHVEQMPEFMGGNAALIKYLQKQLHYPAQALRAGVEGKVFMSFTVNTDGTINDVTVLKGLGYGTDEEAGRVIRQMPAWKPGYQNNHAVPVRYTLPITFKYE